MNLKSFLSTILSISYSTVHYSYNMLEENCVSYLVRIVRRCNRLTLLGEKVAAASNMVIRACLRIVAP